MSPKIYYLPGRGGSLNRGLAEALRARDFAILGRELTGEFAAMSFAEQVSLIAEDLKTCHWSPDARVIANSLGAYLFLHAQTLLPSYPGRVLLLSPIVGESNGEGSQIIYVPPRAGRLLELAQSGRYPTPVDCEIHVGSADTQSNLELLTQFGKFTGIKIQVVPGNGHSLDKRYVKGLLDSRLPGCCRAI